MTQTRFLWSFGLKCLFPSESRGVAGGTRRVLGHMVRAGTCDWTCDCSRCHHNWVQLMFKTEKTKHTKSLIHQQESDCCFLQSVHSARPMALRPNGERQDGVVCRCSLRLLLQ